MNQFVNQRYRHAGYEIIYWCCAFMRPKRPYLIPGQPYIYNILMQPSMWWLVQTLITLLLVSSSFLQMSVKLLQYLMKWVCVCEEREVGGRGLCTHMRACTHSTFFFSGHWGSNLQQQKRKKQQHIFSVAIRVTVMKLMSPSGTHTHTYYNFFFCNHCGINLICTTKTICTVPQWPWSGGSEWGVIQCVLVCGFSVGLCSMHHHGKWITVYQ